MISNVKPSALVIIAFMPIVGTAMATSPPPTPLNIAKVVATARMMFPQTPLILGCMRPKGKVRGSADILALKAGIDGIAFPSEEVIEYALIQGFRVSFSSFCCAQMYLDAAKKQLAVIILAPFNIMTHNVIVQVETASPDTVSGMATFGT